MATQISYTPPALQVIRDEVCYRTPASSDIQRGFHVVSYMAEEEVSRRLETLDGKEVTQYELTACPLTIQKEINDKQVLPLRNKKDLSVVYAVNELNGNGSVTSKYFNIDGTPYLDDVKNLELATDNLNYGSAIVYCHDGNTTVTRTDVWDESRKLVAVIWQDVVGRIIAEPTGILRPGACDLPLDTEVIKQVDNFLENGKPSGKFTTFYRVNVHDNQGAVIYSKTRLADGSDYFSSGRVTAEAIVPPVIGYLRRLTNGEEWESSDRVQSISFAIEYANKNNLIHVITPDSAEPIVLNKLNYNMKWAVDGDADPNLQGIKVKALNGAKALVNWTEQPAMVELLPKKSEIDPLDTEIDIPPMLQGEGYGN
jgi:hypothetical protein